MKPSFGVKRGFCRVFGHRRSMRIRRDGEQWKCQRCAKPEEWTALRAQFREAWWQSLGLSKRKEN